jgi:cell wall-associated NlpC family hydrolase
MTTTRRHRALLAWTAAVAATALATLPAAAHAGSPRRASSSVVVAAGAEQALRLADMYAASGQPIALTTFAEHRDRVAEAVATAIGVDPEVMRRAWGEASIEHQRAVLAAVSQLGVPYRRNTSVEGEGFDCSGLTSFAWRSGGLELARQSGAQIRNARSVDATTAEAGDLAYYPGHVMMYLGVPGAVVHSPQPGQTVEVLMLSERRSSNLRYGDPTG